MWRRGGLMVSALVPGSSGPGSSPGWGHCVVFLGKTLNSHSPLSNQECKWVPANCWGNLTNCRGVTCDGLASRPGGVEIFLAAPCYRNRDKLRQLWASRLQGFTLFQLIWSKHSWSVSISIIKNPEFPYEEIKRTILSDGFLPAERFRILT